MESVISLIEAISWPLTIGLLALLFRSELRSAARRLSAIEYKDFKASFERTLREVETAAEIGPGSTEESQALVESEAENDARYERLERISGVSPRAAIAEAWIEVELAARELAERSDVERKDLRSVSHLLRGLREVINPKDFLLIRDLQQLKNQAIHMPDFSLDEAKAERYFTLAISLVEKLRRGLRWRSGERCVLTGKYKLDGYLDPSYSGAANEDEKEIYLERGETFPPVPSSGEGCWWKRLDTDNA